MNDESRIMELVEAVLESGSSPEEACRRFPDLLPAVRTRLAQFRSAEARIGQMFPPWDSSSVFFRLSARTLPVIPGYEVLETIGAGGMGVVYRARHIGLNRIVAIKMLLAGGFAGPRELERFTREVESIASLCHPNIVQVSDAGECEGRPYFTMEFMGGGSLSQSLKGTPLPAKEAAESAAVLARAVHFAHEHGIIHRDLKPGNVLRSLEGTLKIADFGLAQRLDSAGSKMTLSGARLGTPSYMSPEQAAGQAGAVGPASDIYSLGAILYEVLTGRPPFRGETAAETERQVIHDEPVAPSKLNPRTPRDLETICLKCLQKTPGIRYGAALELAEDLDRFVTGRPIHARPVGRAERAWRWVRRNPARAAVSVSGLAGLGAILGSVLWMLSERAAIQHAVSDDLAEVIRLEQTSDWQAARNTLERAKTRAVAASNRARLMEIASHIERELDLVDKLGDMRFGQRLSAERELDHDKWWGQYRGAFTEAGLLTQGDTPEAFAARVAGSPARTALVAAMDDMMICAANPTDFEWLVSATRLADPDPWRDKARDLATFSSLDALVAVARDAPVESQPATLLLAVAGPLMRARLDDAVSLIRRVQTAHPSDFWANFALGEALARRHDPDAIGFYRAAIAIRPDAAAAYVNLGLAVDEIQNRPDEAIECMSRALALDPRSEVAQYNLALWLYNAARADLKKAAALEDGLESERADLRRSALDRMRKVLEMTAQLAASAQKLPVSMVDLLTGPAFATVHGTAELAKLSISEREQWDRLWRDVGAAAAGQPLDSGRAWAAQGEWVQAAANYARALDQHPTDDGQVWFEYAAVSLLSGDRTGYEKACAHMVERFGSAPDLRAYHVARACTLAPGAVPDLSLPAQLAEQELRQSATQFWSLTEQGALAYRAGRFEESAALFAQSLRADTMPGRAVVNWLWLAMADEDLGKTDEARRWLEKAQSWLDHFKGGMPPSADGEHGLHLHNWLEAKVLAREAAAAIDARAAAENPH